MDTQKLSPSSAASYLTGLSVAGFSFSVNEMVAIGGLCIAIATFAVNWYYRHQEYRLKAVQGITRQDPS